MTKRASLARACLIGGLAACLALPLVPSALGQESKAPEWKHGLEFRVRKAGQPDFDKTTPKFGCEFYLDKNNNQALYITETGSLSVLTAGPLSASTETKAPKWLHGLELKVRKAGENDFSKNSRKYGIEVFRDENTGFLLYISETGSIAALKSASASVASEAKAPTWLFGLELKVRKGGEADFTEKTAKYGIEVFRDENNGNLVYLCETGALAVLPPSSTQIPREPRAPKWLHGLEFRVRPASQPDFTKDTPNFGSEIFRDENTGNLIYISEKGSIAVVAGTPASSGKTQPPRWLHGVVVKVRKAGEADFNRETKQIGIEIFRDENTANLVYLDETASLAVTTGK
jgi:hypothetical protein